MSSHVRVIARRQGAWWLVAGPPIAFLCVFFAWPLAAIIGRGLSWQTVDALVGNRRLLGVVWFTLWQAALSTVLTVTAGLGGAWTLARFRVPARRAVRALLTVPFVLPTVVVGTAFVALLGPTGPLAGLGLYPSVAAILAAHVFFNYAVVLRVVGGVLEQLDPRLDEAARVLGASRWVAAREVTLPLLRPAITAASSIVFLFTFTSFGVVLILGGPSRATLEVEIWRQTAQLLNLPAAAGLALVQLAFVVVALTVHGRLTAQVASAPVRALGEVARRPVSVAEWTFVLSNAALATVLLLTPLAALVARSLHGPSGWGLDSYRALTRTSRASVLFVPPAEAVGNSVRFALLAALLAMAVGILAAAAVHHRHSRASRLLDTVLMLPLGTSAVTLGFGFLISLDRPPLDLRTSVALIPIAHSLVAVPFVMRAVAPAMASVPDRLREAAAVLGASPARARWEIDVPIVSRAALAGAGLAFAVSMGEFGATLFIARPDRPTMPIAIFRLLSQPGATNVGQAMAMSVVLMVVTGLAVLGIERLRAGSIGSFSW